MPRKPPRAIKSLSAVPLPESVCFEIMLNGKRVRRAGFTGRGILDASLTWLRRHPRRNPGEVDSLSLHVGAVDHTKPAWNRQLFWELPAVQVGDRIEIRVTDSKKMDKPSVSRVRVRPRLEPPPVGDPARTDAGGATMWLESRGLYLRTHDRSWGWATVLSKEEARHLATALLNAAKGLAQRGGTKPGTTRRGRRERDK